MDPPIPDDVRSLLQARVESFEHLEILLLLSQHHGSFWTAESVSKRLDIAESLAAEALDHLCRGNLLDVRLGEEVLVFRYAAGTASLDSAVKNLARVYADQRAHVMRIMNDNAIARVRQMAMALLRMR